MSRIIKLTESDIVKLVKKVLNEQWVYQSNKKGGYTLINGPYQGIEAKKLFPSYSEQQYPKELDKNKNPIMKDGSPVPTILTSKYQQIACIPYLFRHAYFTLKKEGLNTNLLKTALGIIGRETTFGTSDRYKYLGPLKKLWQKVGGDSSIGYAQIKPETATDIGIPVDDLYTTIGSLRAAYNIIKNNYDKLVSIGYAQNQPSSNFKEGTGNAALDMAIATFNLGQSYITPYCETTDPKIKGKCSDSQTKSGLQIYKDKKAVNYIPNYTTERWDGVNISTHGYVKEVAKNIKRFTCG
jgi:hypothetical protein